METRTAIPVRFAETDAQGVVHHSHYPVWFELGRTDLLERLGTHYAAWEAEGVRLVVTAMAFAFRAPARYGDTVEVVTRVASVASRKLTFAYRVERAGLLLAEGTTDLVCTDLQGAIRTLPTDKRTLLQGAQIP